MMKGWKKGEELK